MLLIYSAILYFCSCSSFGGDHQNSLFMKIFFVWSVFIFSTILMHAQKQTVKPAPKTATSSLQLKTLEDSANYAMGLSIANFYKQQGVKKLNATIVSRAISDVMAGK